MQGSTPRADVAKGILPLLKADADEPFQEFLRRQQAQLGFTDDHTFAVDRDSAWRSFSSSEREWIVERVRSIAEGLSESSERTPAEVAQELLEASLDLTLRELRPFQYSPQIPCGYSLALNSVLIPQGIVAWEPETFRTGRPRIGNHCGGAWLDVRGACAPKPSANRLFLPRERAARLAVGYGQFVFDEALRLEMPLSSGQGWRNWLRSVVSGVVDSLASFESIEALRQRVGTDAEGLGIMCWFAGKSEVVSRGELRQAFAQAVPMVNRFGHSSHQTGLDARDGINRLLLSHLVGKDLATVERLPLDRLDPDEIA